MLNYQRVPQGQQFTYWSSQWNGPSAIAIRFLPSWGILVDPHELYRLCHEKSMKKKWIFDLVSLRRFLHTEPTLKTQRESRFEIGSFQVLRESTQKEWPKIWRSHGDPMAEQIPHEVKPNCSFQHELEGENSCWAGATMGSIWVYYGLIWFTHDFHELLLQKKKSSNGSWNALNEILMWNPQIFGK